MHVFIAFIAYTPTRLFSADSKALEAYWIKENRNIVVGKSSPIKKII